MKSHELISVYGLECKCDIPEGTVAKAVKGLRGIPEKYHEAVIKELRHYGFNFS